MKINHIVQPGLPLADTAPANDNAVEIVSFIRGLPPGVQARVRDALGRVPRLHRWASVAGARRLLELDLPAEDQHLVEIRLIPPWMRGERRLDTRDAAIRELALCYVDPAPTSCRGLAWMIYYDCRRPQPPGDPRRPWIKTVLENNRGKAPGYETIRDVIGGKPRRSRSRRQIG
jgi:hypothetical protein